MRQKRIRSEKEQEAKWFAEIAKEQQVRRDDAVEWLEKRREKNRVRQQRFREKARKKLDEWVVETID